MYGHGAPPPTRSAGTVITQRVLVVATAVLTCGVLCCVPFFRVAFLRGRWYDWLAAWASMPLVIGAYAVVGSVPEDNPFSDLALSAVLMLLVGSIAYYLVTDIRMVDRDRAYGGYAPPNAPTVTSGPSGYAPPNAPTVTPGPSGYGHPQPAAPAYPYNQQNPQPPIPPAQPPAQQPPARINQVRAELDEISDYLRRHDGNSEGGR